MKDKRCKHNFMIDCHKKPPRFYTIWTMMKQRCSNKKNIAFKRYGGNGIIVCNKWLSFTGFKEDMYESYQKHVKEFGEKETTIDRINGTENYELSNCRWATHKEQAHNKITYRRNKKNRDYIKKLSKIAGVTKDAVIGRRVRGWSENEIINNKKDKKAKYIDFIYKYKDRSSYLNDRNKNVMLYRYGFLDGIIHNLRETGEYFGVSRQRIDQMEKKSFRIMNDSH